MLRFYQRLGFRFLRVERDVFTPEAGYPPTEVDGVPVRDQLWLSLTLENASDRWVRPPAIQLRVARHTARLEELVRFYRDGLGLVEVGSFRNHSGYDGVFLVVPGTGAHLELTAGGGHPAPAPHPESLLVLYLGDAEAVRAVAARLGSDPVIPANPLLGRTRHHLCGPRRLPRRTRTTALAAVSALTCLRFPESATARVREQDPASNTLAESCEADQAP